jgi:uncharacterized protein YuzE
MAMTTNEELPTPRMDQLPDPATWSWRYDKEDDVLFVSVGAPRAAISVDIDGEFWIRIDPVSGEVHGFEFEDFENVFLKRHPDVAVAWRELNKPKEVAPPAKASWITILLEFIAKAFGGKSNGGHAGLLSPA